MLVFSLRLWGNEYCFLLFFVFLQMSSNKPELGVYSKDKHFTFFWGGWLKIFIMIKYIWHKICHFNHFQCTIQCINYIRTVVQPSLLCVSKSFPSPQKETGNIRQYLPSPSSPSHWEPLLYFLSLWICLPRYFI